MKTLQILDVGCGPAPVAAAWFQPILDQGYEYEVTGVDVNPDNNPTVVHDLRNPFPEQLIGKFDLVLASHVFEHLPRHEVLQAYKNVAATLAPGGELWVIVPSLEWCAENILANTRYKEVLMCLYGSKGDHMAHFSGFTLPVLRDIIKMCGLVVRKAYQTPFAIHSTEADGSVVTTHAVQNIVIGARPDGE